MFSNDHNEVIVSPGVNRELGNTFLLARNIPQKRILHVVTSS